MGKAPSTVIWGILENKTNANSNWNIGLLKTTFEEEWNKMSEELVLMVWKSFQRHIDTKTEKNGSHIELINSFVSIILFCC